MKHYRRPGIFPAIFVGVILLIIGSSILMHIFFPFYPGGYYGWHPFFPWGGFFFLRTLFFFGLLFFIARRFFWGHRWAYGGPGWGYGGRGWAHGGRGWAHGQRGWAHGGPHGCGQFQEYRSGGAPFEKTGSRNSDDYLELVSGFGTVEKKVSSRNFQGGDVTTTMGQLILDLRDADFTGTVRLKVTQINGTTVIITSIAWDVRAGEGTIFTTYQDSNASKAAVNPDKVLIIDGTCVMGGIEVRTS